MEVSVSFTDGSVDLNSTEGGMTYMVEDTPAGRAWIPKEGLILTRPAAVRYEKHPWIEAFEFDGIKAAPARRTGIGTKGAKDFVRSLSTIWSKAYDEYRRFGGDAGFDAKEYFRFAAESFILAAEESGNTKMLAKFCGLTENMWREGSEEMLGICIGTVVPVLKENVTSRGVFIRSITTEFSGYLEKDQ